MRIVHLTDLHIQHVPRFSELRPKRLLGSANLFLAGRRHHFDVTVQRAAVAAACALEPDVTVITGDLTAQGLDSEFATVQTLLKPLAEVGGLYLIPGNHDLYVPEHPAGATMRRWLGEWMSPAAPGLASFGEVSFLYIETCRAAMLSNGTTDLSQLAIADRLLQDAREFVFLCLHYPLRSRHGQPYGPARRANDQAADIEAWLRRQSRVHAVLHGHEHHGFRTTVPSAAGDIPILNPGASGYAHLPRKHRTAHFNVYEVQGDQLTVERWTWDGAQFQPEVGGAYATGR
jgi:3',5'-cyclic AMP phosphodiesterase CpdA